MPYMHVSLTKVLTEEEKQLLYEELGNALSVIPGKEHYMLIADIDDGKQIYAGGRKQENFVFIDARYFSKFEYHIKKNFAQSVFKAVQDIVGASQENVSMTISEYSTWGGFGDLADEYYMDSKESEMN